MTTTQAASPTDANTPTHLADLENTTMPTPTRGPLLPQRAVLLLLVAVALGGIIGALTFVATPVLATAVIAGLVTAGAVLVGGHQLIE